MRATIRVKSRWFKSGQPRPPRELAGAAAFIAWRVAQHALKRMRAAGFDIDPGPPYFAFLAEFLAFLVAIADRIAYAGLAQEARVEFTTALAHRAGEILDVNARELLGAKAGETEHRFVALVNERGADYSVFGYAEDGPDFGFLRCLGNHVTGIMPLKDQAWTVAQVMECEAPAAAATLRQAMRDLFSLESRRPGERAVQVAGE